MLLEKLYWRLAWQRVATNLLLVKTHYLRSTCLEFFQTKNLCLLTRTFDLFTVNVITTRFGLRYIFLFSGGSDHKESVCKKGDRGLILGSGRSPGKANGIPFQYSCLENPMDRGAWQATVHGTAKSRTQLSN